MRIVYVNRKFLDYRVPVLEALNEKSGENLTVMYSRNTVAPRVDRKLRKAIGNGAMGLDGELRIGNTDRTRLANQGVSFRFHPGVYGKLLALKPDVVVAEGFFKWSAAAAAAKIIKGIPLVFCYERTPHTERNAQWYRTAYRKIMVTLADGICCNGRLSAEYVHFLGASLDRITLGHMAADIHGIQDQIRRLTHEETSKQRLGLKEEESLFLYVGQLLPKKGVMELLRAWIERRNPQGVHWSLSEMAS